ncbi:hypothetical protein EP7_004476 [Isosphaeraceae bacterium EP7]
MHWRSLSPVRACSAAGLLFLTASGAFGDEPAGPVPSAASLSESVDILKARKSGELQVEVRGQGEGQVKLSVKNLGTRRLNVVLPPGLVAASSTGQGGMPGGGGGNQSMGLGPANGVAGAFGQFRGTDEGVGFRSVAAEPKTSAAGTIVVPSGQSVDVSLPAVCLNFGLATPKAKDRLQLMDVDDYSNDPRTRKALRSLATYGSSFGVAQAVMWNVCNDLSFDSMAEKGGKLINRQEVALASRFVEAVDAASDRDLIDPAYLTEGRLFVRVRGEGAVAKDAKRLEEQLDGQRIFGLPARVLTEESTVPASSSAIYLTVQLSATAKGQTRGKVAVHAVLGQGNASSLGTVSFSELSAPSGLDGATLAGAIDHAVAAGFVSAKPTKKIEGGTVLRIENRLPFTIASLDVKPTGSSGSPTVHFGGVGVGAGRTGTATIQASGGTVEHVELNGL